MRALAYLLGGRALDVARAADSGIRWPKADEPLEPMATTPASAAAWRRWRDRGDDAAGAATQRTPEGTSVLSPKRA